MLFLLEELLPFRADHAIARINFYGNLFRFTSCGDNVNSPESGVRRKPSHRRSAKARLGQSGLDPTGQSSFESHPSWDRTSNLLTDIKILTSAAPRTHLSSRQTELSPPYRDQKGRSSSPRLRVAALQCERGPSCTDPDARFLFGPERSRCNLRLRPRETRHDRLWFRPEPAVGRAEPGVAKRRFLPRGPGGEKPQTGSQGRALL